MRGWLGGWVGVIAKVMIKYWFFWYFNFLRYINGGEEGGVSRLQQHWY